MDYKTLKERAIKTQTQIDIDMLGVWFLQYGTCYWNGEYYDADDYKLYPVYKETEPDNFEIIGWKLI